MFRQFRARISAAASDDLEQADGAESSRFPAKKLAIIVVPLVLLVATGAYFAVTRGTEVEGQTPGASSQEAILDIQQDTPSQVQIEAPKTFIQTALSATRKHPRVIAGVVALVVLVLVAVVVAVLLTGGEEAIVPDVEPESVKPGRDDKTDTDTIEDDQSEGLSAGAIIGLSLGGLALAAIIGTVIVLAIKRGFGGSTTVNQVEKEIEPTVPTDDSPTPLTGGSGGDSNPIVAKVPDIQPPLSSFSGSESESSQDSEAEEPKGGTHGFAIHVTQSDAQGINKLGQASTDESPDSVKLDSNPAQVFEYKKRDEPASPIPSAPQLSQSPKTTYRQDLIAKIVRNIVSAKPEGENRDAYNRLINAYFGHLDSKLVQLGLLLEALHPLKNGFNSDFDTLEVGEFQIVLEGLAKRLGITMKKPPASVPVYKATLVGIVNHYNTTSPKPQLPDCSPKLIDCMKRIVESNDKSLPPTTFDNCDDDLLGELLSKPNEFTDDDLRDILATIA